MNRGIRFKIPNKWGTLLSDILKGIKYEDYVWEIDEDEVFLEGGDFLFSTNRLSGHLFKEAISSAIYYVVFINLQAFPCDENICEISSYSDFIKSDCEIIMFICDNIYVDIYVKNQCIIELLHKNAIEHKFTEIEIITDTNDTRSVFQAK